MIFSLTSRNLLNVSKRKIIHKKRLFLILFYLFVCIYSLTNCKPKQEIKQVENYSFRLYSDQVKDSFNIYIQKPLEYEEKSRKSYPLVLLTDANFYFPMLAPIVHQFERTGLIKPIILVGVGYDSLEEMDSLRVRDFLYPSSLPSDEMQATGGAKKFYAFLKDELIPKLADSLRFVNDKALLGHSFGGYFSLLTCFEQIKSGQNCFNRFVSASPTLWYNDFYLNRLAESLKNNSKKDSTHLYLSVGGLEDAIWYVKPFQHMAKKLDSNATENFHCTPITYKEMDHMDVGLLSFIHALKVWYKQE